MRNLQLLYLYMIIVFSWGMFLTFPIFIACFFGSKYVTTQVGLPYSYYDETIAA